MEWKKESPTIAGWYWYYQPLAAPTSNTGKEELRKGRLEMVEIYLARANMPVIGHSALPVADWVGPFETFWFGPVFPPPLPEILM